MNALLNRSRLMYMLISVMLILVACKSQRTLTANQAISTERDSVSINKRRHQTADVVSSSFDTTDDLTTIVDVAYSAPDSSGHQYPTRVIYTRAKNTSASAAVKVMRIQKSDSLSTTQSSSITRQSSAVKTIKKRSPPLTLPLLIILTVLVVYAYRKHLLRFLKRLLLHF
jgi:hypothetical protein